MAQYIKLLLRWYIYDKQQLNNHNSSDWISANLDQGHQMHDFYMMVYGDTNGDIFTA